MNWLPSFLDELMKLSFSSNIGQLVFPTSEVPTADAAGPNTPKRQDRSTNATMLVGNSENTPDRVPTEGENRQ